MSIGMQNKERLKYICMSWRTQMIKNFPQTELQAHRMLLMISIKYKNILFRPIIPSKLLDSQNYFPIQIKRKFVNSLFLYWYNFDTKMWQILKEKYHRRISLLDKYTNDMNKIFENWMQQHRKYNVLFSVQMHLITHSPSKTMISTDSVKFCKDLWKFQHSFMIKSLMFIW
jgi:hypothetical protein